MSVYHECMSNSADLDAALRFHSARPQEWRIAIRTPVHDSVTDGRTGRYQTADLVGAGNRSYNLGLMLARAAELAAEPDPAGQFVVIGEDGTELEPPSGSWTGYLVTIVIAGEVWPVELEMDEETAKRRARTWAGRYGSRLRAHTFAGDSYYTYTRLDADCQNRRDQIDDMNPGWEA